MAQGACGTVDCCHERESQTHLWEAPPDGPHRLVGQGARQPQVTTEHARRGLPVGRPAFACSSLPSGARGFTSQPRPTAQRSDAISGKVTNADGGVAYSAAPYYRVINDQDIVPQIPPSNLVIDFSGPFTHFGPEITLKKEGTWDYSPVHIPRDFISGHNWKELNAQDVEDHAIAHYIDELKAVK